MSELAIVCAILYAALVYERCQQKTQRAADALAPVGWFLLCSAVALGIAGAL